MPGSIEEKCDLWNKGIDDLIGIHLNTPSPSGSPQGATRMPYLVPRPSEFVPIRPNLAERMFRSKRDRVDCLNAEASEQYAKACEAWEQERAEHEARETVRLELFDPSMPLKADRVQEYLSDVLGCVEWPRETIVSLECDDPITGVMIDIDLPEINDMPDKSAVVAARGLKLNIKDRPEAQRRREYMTHVHGVAFRVIGEVFAALPRIQRVMCSGFSQRVDRSTGQVRDEYLFCIRVPRSAWANINFSRLADLDLPSCLATFDIRREMTSKGVFRPRQRHCR